MLHISYVIMYRKSQKNITIKFFKNYCTCILVWDRLYCKVGCCKASYYKNMYYYLPSEMIYCGFNA